MTRRRLMGAALVLAVVTVGTLAYERLSFDRAAWISDYEFLRAHVSRSYANLLWSVEQNGLDPVALHRSTLHALENARTGRSARAAVESFVTAFKDGHLRVASTPLTRRLEGLGGTPADSLEVGRTSADACAALGFRDDTDGLSFRSAELVPLAGDDSSFAAATFQARGRTVGILRIPIFDTKRYLGACRRAYDAVVAGRACDSACTADFVRRAVPNQLLKELASQVRALAASGARTLAVDLTGNGGGTDWVEPAARVVSPRQLDCPRIAFVKGPQWARTFADLTARIDGDLATVQGPDDAALLSRGRARALDLGARADAACDLGALWTGAPAPACSPLVADTEHTACGLLGPLPRGSLPGAVSRGALFLGLDYDYEEAVFPGRVAVIVDGGTASAAEYFAATLADNGAATILGARTYGAGCGFTDGNEGITLPHSGLLIVMPDCLRMRRDGTNERAGLVPDVAVDWTAKDSAEARWRKLISALEKLGDD